MSRAITESSFSSLIITLIGTSGGFELNKELKNSGLSDKDTLKAVIASGTVIPWLEKVALSAEAVVLDAFDNSGPGWAAWKNKNYENNTGMILTDTQQLRDSIGTRVKEAP